MSDKPSEHIAFLIVECGMSLKEAQSLILNEPLFAAIHKAYERKLQRQDDWVALICYCAGNAMGGNSKSKVSDFKRFPIVKQKTEPKTAKQLEAEWLNFAMEHNKMYSKLESTNN